MGKSIAAALLISVVILAVTVVAFLYTKNTENLMINTLSQVEKNLELQNSQGIDDAINIWKNRKTYLTYIINHRDIEEISKALLKTKKEAECQNFDAALNNLAVAVFHIKNLPENERVSVGNIF